MAINKDKVNVLKKFAKDPVGYVAKKSKCVKAAKAKGLSSKEASAFCRSGSKSEDRLKAATKIKAVPSPKDIRQIYKTSLRGAKSKIKPSEAISYTKALSEGFTAERNDNLVARPPKRMKNNGFLEPR